LLKIDEVNKLSCCEYSKAFICLEFESYYADSSDHFHINKPMWVVNGSKLVIDDYKHTERYTVNFREISICPSCGVKLPSVKLRKEPPHPIVSITDGGYYCDTCTKRLIACECLNPSLLWEIVEEDT